MSPTTQGLPPYLKKFVADQDYDSYTPRDHAAWRFIMRQNCAFFSKHAVPMYMDGLKKTGISLEKIPRVSDIDDCLAKFGWGAVPVEGFIPPTAFLDFQARGVLPIACDMRTVDHIGYTPAPDIVHEAAGHAPIISYPPYSEYLHRYATMARKAIATQDDVRLYEAIRYLSDIKENPDATKNEIAAGEARLKEVTRSLGRASEAAKVARMNWWTVEYGLAGDVRSPRIYGAGLLSSVGESQNCLSQSVKKIPLSVECVDMPYNITEPQPQLYVAKDMDHLVSVLEEFEKGLAFRLGEEAGLHEAKISQTVTTTQLDSGLEISGVVDTFSASDGKIEFVRYSGPVQLSYKGSQIPGHGRETHAVGFSSPLGRFKNTPSKKMADLLDSDLKSLGLEKGKLSRLSLNSGFEIEGLVAGWTRFEGKLVLIHWKNCRVTRGSLVAFQPDWGDFDQAVGEAIPSVWGGPSDRAAFGELNMGTITSSPGRASPFRPEELSLFEAYNQVRALREASPKTDEAARVVEQCLRAWPDEWLLQIELCEAGKKLGNPDWIKTLESNLRRLELASPQTTRALIQKGRELI